MIRNDAARAILMSKQSVRVGLCDCCNFYISTRILKIPPDSESAPPKTLNDSLS